MYMDDNEILLDYRAAKDKKKQVQILAELNACPPEQIIEILVAKGVSYKELPRGPRKKQKEEKKDMHDVEDLVIEREEAREAAREAAKPVKKLPEPPANVETRKTAPGQPLELLINSEAMELISNTVSGVMEYMDDMETLQAEMMYMKGVDHLRRELIRAIKEHV